MIGSPRLLGCLLLVASVGFATGASARAPSKHPSVTAENPSNTKDDDGSSRASLDLNRATIDELCTLPGIGRKRAQTIVDYRKRRPFTRLTQLLRVRGIGKKTLRRLKPLVHVERPVPARGRGR